MYSYIPECGPQKRFFSEIAYFSSQQFETREPERVGTYASDVASWLHAYPPIDVLRAEFVFSEWRPDLVRRVVKYLVPDNVRVTVISKKSRFFSSAVSD